MNYISSSIAFFMMAYAVSIDLCVVRNDSVAV